MNDTKNLTIGVLSTTAVIMLVGLVILQSRPVPAHAAGTTLVAGDYVLAVGSLNQVDEDFLYVVDNGESKVIVYRFDGGRGRMEIVDGLDLAEIRKTASEPPGGAPPPRRRP